MNSLIMKIKLSTDSISPTSHGSTHSLHICNQSSPAVWLIVLYNQSPKQGDGHPCPLIILGLHHSLMGGGGLKEASPAEAINKCVLLHLLMHLWKFAIPHLKEKNVFRLAHIPVAPLHPDFCSGVVNTASEGLRWTSAATCVISRLRAKQIAGNMLIYNDNLVFIWFRPGYGDRDGGQGRREKTHRKRER